MIAIRTLTRTLPALLPLLLFAPAAHAADKKADRAAQKADKQAKKDAAKNPPDHWVSTWTTAAFPMDSPREQYADLGGQPVTLRQIVHTTLGGSLARVELTNEFGTEPLSIGAAHVAVVSDPSTGDIALSSANALTFSGSPAVTIPPGARVLSDPASLTVPAGGDLAISLYLPAQAISRPTWHGNAYTTSFLVPGNRVGLHSLTATVVGELLGPPGAAVVPTQNSTQTPAQPLAPAAVRRFGSWFFLGDVMVQTGGDDAAVIALGDSITDGAGSTPDAHNTWPALLADRLRNNKKTRGLAVLNEGIGGNRILRDGTAASALARFDDAVLTHPSAAYLIILEGINDIGRAFSSQPDGPATAEDLIRGLTQLTERAHVRGLKVIGATLTPYLGAGYATPQGEAVRQQVNAWVRSSKLLDGFVDFDDATRDPHALDRFRPAYHSGDWLHPSPAGYKAMADAFDLKLFDPKATTKLDITYHLH